MGGTESITVYGGGGGGGWVGGTTPGGGSPNMGGGGGGGVGPTPANPGQNLSQSQYDYYYSHPNSFLGGLATVIASDHLSLNMPATYSDPDQLARDLRTQLEQVSTSTQSEIAVQIFYNPSTGQYSYSNPVSNGDAVYVHPWEANGPTGSQGQLYGFFHTHPYGTDQPSGGDAGPGSWAQVQGLVVYTSGNDGEVNYYDTATGNTRDLSG